MGLGAISKIDAQERFLSRPGIVVPLSAESEGLAHLNVPKNQVVSLSAHALLRVSGIGERRARLAAEFVVENGATSLISYGSSGGLHPSVVPGSLVLPVMVISASDETFPTDRSWLERLLSKLCGHLKVSKGPLIESQMVLHTPREKTSLHDRSGAVAVDMESAAVARVSQEAKIPFMAIRAVVDPCHMSLPHHVLKTVDSYGCIRSYPLLRCLLRHPWELLPLLRLAWCFRKARATLRMAAVLTGDRFMAP
jgi:adenosylhomocysteine nucleosidase